MNFSTFELLGYALKGTLLDVLPIILVLIFFQVVIIRKLIPNLKQKLTGLVLVVLGLGIFIVGLEQCVFPIGTQMANQLTDLLFLTGNDSSKIEILKNSKIIDPGLYLWTYLFAFLIGFKNENDDLPFLNISISARQ